MMLNSTQNLQPLDVLACNSPNKPSFQNLTKDLMGIPKSDLFVVTMTVIHGAGEF